MSNVPESNEVSAHQYRQAQARRLTRYCSERGLNPHTATDDDLAPILDKAGKIVPEPADFRA